MSRFEKLLTGLGMVLCVLIGVFLGLTLGELADAYFDEIRIERSL